MCYGGVGILSKRSQMLNELRLTVGKIVPPQCLYCNEPNLGVLPCVGGDLEECLHTFGWGVIAEGA